MSGLSSMWSSLTESLFPTVAFADVDVNATDDSENSDDQTVPKNIPQEATADETPNDCHESKDSEDSEESESKESEEPEEPESEESEETSNDTEDGEDEDEDEDEDDEDEDEDELKDPLDTLREKYSATVCHSFKHHFDECVERVTKAQEAPGYEDLEYKEDCVEEFFHLQHCLNEQIAPVLFSKLK